MTLILVAEGRREIGLGHVFSCMALAAAGRRMGLKPLFQTAGNLAVPVFRRWGQDAQEYRADEAILTRLRGNGSAIAIVDVREPQEFDFTPLRRAGYLTCAIEEFGEGAPGADVMVNPAPVRAWHRLPDGYRSVLTGLKYLPVGPEFGKVNVRPRPALSKGRRVLVSMGGVDRTGATLVTVKALGIVHAKHPGLLRDVRIVCGPGFTYAASLARLLEEESYPHEVLTDVPDMWEELFRADLVISAGGNTLFEAACCGTPSVVFWEDTHEGERGEAAQKAGFARCFGRGEETPPDEMAWLVAEALGDDSWLIEASRMGRQAVDGRGASRILESLVQMELVNAG